MSIIHRWYAITALAGLVTASSAGAQQSYPQTLYWGSGLIDIPVAWVSPVSGDFSLGFSAKTIKGSRLSSGLGIGQGINSNLALSASILGRVELGLSLYSDDPEWGLFGRALLLDEEQFRGRPGITGWIPSVAVGLENVGPYSKIDRFALGYHLGASTNANPTHPHVADSLHQGFSTAETVYGAVTKSFMLSQLSKGGPNIGLSFTVGYGNGLFSDDGGLGSAYAKHATGGVFGGVKMDLYPSPHSVFSLMVENNAWDYNLGAVFDYRGLRAGVYWTEVGAGSAPDSARVPYNYSKFAFTVGWQSNALALLRGNVLKDRIAELERQKQQLLAEINARQQRVAALELEIDRYRAQNLLELEQRRAQAEQELRAEREALQRLEERLRRLEQNTPPNEQNP